MHKNAINLVGKKFGKLRVTEICDGRFGKRKEIQYNCLCECGGERRNVFGQNLRCGRTHSCGCVLKNPPNKCHDRKLAIIKNLFNHLKLQSGRKIRRDVTISFSYFSKLIEQDCFYCGCPPSNIARDKKRKNHKSRVSDIEFRWHGLDRVNNNQNYSKKNTVACCRNCNFCKGRLSQEAFLQIVKSIYQNLYAKK